MAFDLLRLFALLGSLFLAQDAGEAPVSASARARLAVEDAEARLTQAAAGGAEERAQAQAALATALHEQGCLLQGAGALAEARASLERALELRRAAFGPDHGWVAQAQITLGRVLQQLGDLERAEPALRDAVRIRDDTVGPGHEWAVDDRCTLAELLRLRGDLEGAQAELELALRHADAEIGSGHFQTGRAHYFLGDVHGAARRPAEAALAYERALSIFEQLGDRHWSWSALQRLLQRTERSADLRVRLKAILAAYERDEADGRDLGFILQELGDWRWKETGEEERGEFLQRAVEHFSRTLGPEEPSTLAAGRRLAEFHSSRQDFEAALREYERLLGIRKRVAPDSLDTVIDASSASRMLEQLGRHGEARARMEEAVALYEGREDHPNPHFHGQLVRMLYAQGDGEGAQRVYARFLEFGERAAAATFESRAQTLASDLEKLGAVDMALDLWQRVLASRAGRFGPDDVRLGWIHRRIGQRLQDLGRASEARTSFLRALDLQDPAADSSTLNRVQLLMDLALLDIIGARFGSAADHLEEIVTISQGFEDPIESASASMMLGLARAMQGEHRRAADAMAQTSALLESMRGRDDIAFGNLLWFSALPWLEIGNLERGRELAERSLEILERRLGAAHPDLAMALGVRARAEIELGRLAEGRELAERALVALEGSGPSVPNQLLGGLLNNMGQALSEQGLLDDAERFLERAAPLMEAHLGEGNLATARGWSNLALVQLRAGRVGPAREHFQRALGIAERIWGSGHPEVALGLANLARCLQVSGELGEASELIRRALGIWELDDTPSHPRYGRALQVAAAILRAQGRGDEARATLERARAFFARVLPGDHPWQLDCENESLRLALDQGQDAQAVKSALEALRISAVRADRLLWSLTEHERLQVAARLRESLELLLAAELGDVPEAARYAAVLDWKGRASRSLRSSRRANLGNLEGEERKDLAELEAVQSDLSRLVFAREVDDRQARERRLEELRARRAELEARLVRAAGRGASSEEEAEVDLGRLRAGLPAGSVVLDFFVHRVFLRASSAQYPEGWAPEPHLSAWILRVDSAEILRHDFGPVGPLQDLVRSFLRDLTGQRGLGLDEAGTEGSTALWAALWAPLVPLVGDAHLILVSPDTFLATLPFETLRGADGRFLVEDRAFFYLQDATAVATMGDRARAEAPALLAVGGVDYRRRDDLAWRTGGGSGTAVPDESPLLASAALRGSFTGHWTRLAATGPEARAVADLHAEVFEDQAPQLVLLGAVATEERLAAELGAYPIVHLATHGFFQPEGLASMWEEVRGADGVQLEMREAERRVLGMLPGLLSGLVCAGANSDPEPGRDDGYLTAEELGWLDLSAVELVVLSACETGLGSPSAGEGLLGLRRTLTQAGVDTVVSSLWPVRDDATGELMRDFYAGLWLRGEGRLAALRGAQLAMLKRNRIEHGEPLPATWGAFVLSGDWR